MKPNFFALLFSMHGISAGISLILLSLISGGCFRHFYSTNTSNHSDSATLQKLIYANKYFIVHNSFQNKDFALKNIKVAHDTLEADPDPLLSEHAIFLNPAKPDHNAFPVKYKDEVLYEVHLYSKIPLNDSVHLRVALNDFSRMDVYELDKKSTRKSRIGSIVGITLTTAAVVAIIVAASEPSHKSTTPTPQPCEGSGCAYGCSPQVYLTENEKTELQGTMYSGAVYASLERTDYLPLSTSHLTSDKIRLVVKGKDAEEIMLRQIQLVEVTHKDDEHVLIDRKGKVLVYNEPVGPTKSIHGLQEVVRKQIIARDDKYYSFTNHPDAANSSDVILHFKKPLNCLTGKLILNAKNSGWSYYLFSQFKSLYGDYYPSLIQKKDKANPENVLQCELDQFLPLLVSVKGKDGWKFVDYFPTSGNTKSRDLIMELDLKDFMGSDHLEIRLQTTFMFWDLDYAGMDFSTNDYFRTAFIPADRAYKSNQHADTIEVSGNNSAVKINEQERLNLEFSIQKATGNGMKNSYFLAGNGYYHDNTPIEGKPQFAELFRFAGKGAFDKYSREKFISLVNGIQDK